MALVHHARARPHPVDRTRLMSSIASSGPLDESGVGPGRPAWLHVLRWRLGRLVISLWLVLTASFLMIHLIPGDPVRAALGPTAPPELVAARRGELRLDDSLVSQYLTFFRGVLTGDLGTSMVTNQPVAQVIGERLPATVTLALLAFVVILALAVPIGAAAALLTRSGRGRRLELAFTSTSTVIAAIPEFLIAVLLVLLFGLKLQWFPVAGADGLGSYVLPVLALSIGPIAVMSRIVRVETLSVLGHDYIRTARAKRLPSRLVYLRHVLPNSVTATLTLAGLLLTGLVAGTVIVENVFAWPGLGLTIVQSILQKDYPMVQGIVLVYGSMVLVVNLLVDVLLAVLDPRSTIGES